VSEDLLRRVAASPDIPVTLRCNAGDVFAYQDPGTGQDTPEGAEFNMKRDLEILQRIDIAPGTTLPARIVFHRILDRISSVSGICGHPDPASDAWRGCPVAGTGRYEAAVERGIASIVPPRNDPEMKRDKELSIAAMIAAEAKRVRPHILLCAMCQYGGGTRPPFPEDNLPELVQLILEKPDLLIEMAPGADWMMCAPCPNRAPGSGSCVNVKGSGGLTNQLRDLRTLQKLGMQYGSRRKAAPLFRLIFDRIPTTLDICRLDSPVPSVWWDGCGARTVGNENYEKGMRMLLNHPAFRSAGAERPTVPPSTEKEGP
jgi:hypothetical protein